MKIKSQNENKRLDSSLEANYNTSKGGSQLANRKEENMSIVEARMRTGLSQRDMADLLHLPYSTYNEYETGRKTVPAEIATKISEIVGEPVGSLFLPVRFAVSEQKSEEECENNKDSA